MGGTCYARFLSHAPGGGDVLCSLPQPRLLFCCSFFPPEHVHLKLRANPAWSCEQLGRGYTPEKPSEGAGTPVHAPEGRVRHQDNPLYSPLRLLSRKGRIPT